MALWFTCFLLLTIASSCLGGPPTGERGKLRRYNLRRRGLTEKEADNVNDRGAKQLLGGHQELTGTSRKQIPAQYDWRKYGVISSVKEPVLWSSPAIVAGECVESLNAIKNGKLTDLSLPQVQDCCDTGKLVQKDIFKCIVDNGGICEVAAYPKAKDECRNNTCPTTVKIRGANFIPPNQVAEMVTALLDRPLMVYVNAMLSSFWAYSGGIYSDNDCNNDEVDHAMQLVGYGEENGTEYWLCKNSYGKEWGEKGYMRITKGNNMCGIESWASYPI